MKTARQLSIFLLLLIVLPAFYVGFRMISDPSGASLGLPFYLLNGTVLNNYAASGWVMLTVVALSGTITIVCILFKSRSYSFLIILQGVLICVFVIAQMILLQDTFIIQYAVLIVGGGLIGLGILQNQRKIVTDTEKGLRTGKRQHHHKHRKRGNK